MFVNAVWPAYADNRTHCRVILLIKTMQRKKYDTAVVFLYRTGNEHLLPKEFRRQIPYTTIASWRQADYSKYVGHEFRGIFNEALSGAEVRLAFSKLKKTVYGLARAWVNLSAIIKPLIKSAGKNHRQQGQVLRAIRLAAKHIGIERTLKLAGLTKAVYYQWLTEARFDCFDSYASLCVKRHPQQLSQKEILGIKKLLYDPTYEHWPILSVAAMAMRKKNLVVSAFSWYKYAKAYRIERKLVRKFRKITGLQATRPNEYLHVDTTFYPLNDDKEVCISFVMDNYSKIILGFHVAERNTFEIVRNSLRKALKVIARHPDVKKTGHSFMVTDGGSENHNKKLNEFIAKLTKHRITKIRALKDIRFSNSPVEAIHRIMKGRYLKNQRFANIKSLVAYLNWAVNDYNSQRPHYKHKYLTPHEAYFNIPLGFEPRKRTLDAIKARVAGHKNAKCIQCKAFRQKKACGKKGECGTSIYDIS